MANRAILIFYAVGLSSFAMGCLIGPAGLRSEPADTRTSLENELFNLKSTLPGDELLGYGIGSNQNDSLADVQADLLAMQMLVLEIKSYIWYCHRLVQANTADPVISKPEIEETLIVGMEVRFNYKIVPTMFKKVYSSDGKWYVAKVVEINRYDHLRGLFQARSSDEIESIIEKLRQLE